MHTRPTRFWVSALAGAWLVANGCTGQLSGSAETPDRSTALLGDRTVLYQMVRDPDITSIRDIFTVPASGPEEGILLPANAQDHLKLVTNIAIQPRPASARPASEPYCPDGGIWDWCANGGAGACIEQDFGPAARRHLQVVAPTDFARQGWEIGTHTGVHTQPDDELYVFPDVPRSLAFQWLPSPMPGESGTIGFLASNPVSGQWKRPDRLEQGKGNLPVNIAYEFSSPPSAFLGPGDRIHVSFDLKVRRFNGDGEEKAIVFYFHFVDTTDDLTYGGAPFQRELAFGVRIMKRANPDRVNRDAVNLDPFPSGAYDYYQFGGRPFLSSPLLYPTSTQGVTELITVPADSMELSYSAFDEFRRLRFTLSYEQFLRFFAKIEANAERRGAEARDAILRYLDGGHVVDGSVVGPVSREPAHYALRSFNLLTETQFMRNCNPYDDHLYGPNRTNDPVMAVAVKNLKIVRISN